MSSNQPTGQAQSDIAGEALRIVDAARDAGIPLRIIGGLAVKVRCSAGEYPVRREFSDMDFVTYRQHALRLAEPMESIQYHPNERFNALYGRYRLLFENSANGIHFDVLLDQFEMCHKLSFAGRLELDDYTIPLSDLLLTKLQIIELNEKDLRDIYSLLLSHEVTGGRSEDGIDRVHIAALCGADWGWYRTIKDNLEKALDLGSDFLPENEREILAERITRLADAIEASPKSMRWKLRSLIGDRVRWYEVPEEVSTERPV